MKTAINLSEDVIPTVERMLKKEKEHLKRLFSRNAPQEFINRSQETIIHLELRLNQYKEYSNKNQ